MGLYKCGSINGYSTNGCSTNACSTNACSTNAWLLRSQEGVIHFVLQFYKCTTSPKSEGCDSFRFRGSTNACSTNAWLLRSQEGVIHFACSTNAWLLRSHVRSTTSEKSCICSKTKWLNGGNKLTSEKSCICSNTKWLNGVINRLRRSHAFVAIRND